MPIASSFFGVYIERAHLTDYAIGADQKIQTGWLALYFSDKLKQQLDEVLNLGLVSGAIAQVMPFCLVVFSLTVSFL